MTATAKANSANTRERQKTDSVVVAVAVADVVAPEQNLLLDVLTKLTFSINPSSLVSTAPLLIYLFIIFKEKYKLQKMRFSLSVLVVLAACFHANDAQFNGMGRFFGNFAHGAMNMFMPFRQMFGGFGRPSQPSAAENFGIGGGTGAPQATGRDELNPADCGRDKKTGKGSLCFPDGLLCEQSRTFFVFLQPSNDVSKFQKCYLGLKLCFFT